CTVNATDVAADKKQITHFDVAYIVRRRDRKIGQLVSQFFEPVFDFHPFLLRLRVLVNEYNGAANINASQSCMNEISKPVDIFRGAQWNNALSILPSQPTPLTHAGI